MTQRGQSDTIEQSADLFEEAVRKRQEASHGRNARDGKARRRAGRYPEVRGTTRHMAIEPGRIEATRRALAGFLQDKTLSPKFARLRDAAIRWLRAPPIL